MSLDTQRLQSVNEKCLKPGQKRTEYKCKEYYISNGFIGFNQWDAGNIGPDTDWKISRVDGSLTISYPSTGRLIGYGRCVQNKQEF